MNRSQTRSARVDDGASAAGGSYATAIATTPVTLLTRRRFLAVIASIALAAGGYLVVAFLSGWDAVSAAVARVGWLGTSVVVLMGLVSYLVRTLRWAMFMKALGHSVPARDNVRIYLSGFDLLQKRLEVAVHVRLAHLER